MTTGVRRLLVLVLIALGGLVVVASPAYACSEPSPPLGAQLRGAEYVFSGTVRQVVGNPSRDDERIVYVVEVRRVYKGDVTTETTVTSPSARADCGLQGIGEDRRYLFVARSASSGVIEAFSHEGTRRQSSSLTARVTDVLGEGEPPMAPVPQERQPDEGATLERLDESSAPGLGVTVLPGVGLAVLGLVLLGLARTLGRIRS